MVAQAAIRKKKKQTQKKWNASAQKKAQAKTETGRKAREARVQKHRLKKA